MSDSLTLRTITQKLAWIVLTTYLWLLAPNTSATPIALQQSFAGNLDFVVTGGTLRTQSNAGNACAVTNGTVNASLSGIPVGATIRAAYLYWGGSDRKSVV